MVFPATMWILLGISLLLCCMGFYRFVWFMSVGYGLSVAGIGATLLIMSLSAGKCSFIYALQCILLIVYGIRLGGFLFVRELKNVTYRKKLKEVGGDTTVPFFVAIVMWLCCGALYICQTAGPIYRLFNEVSNRSDIPVWIGTAICFAGVCLEALADKQKGDQKKLHPDMPATEGLYRLCRCPNYFGEMLFWTGIFVSGLNVFVGWQWAVALFGYVCIIFIMLSGAKRVETRHIKNYGHKAEYTHYADTVPLIFPLLPLYHMTNPEKIAKEEAKKAAKKKK